MERQLERREPVKKKRNAEFNCVRWKQRKAPDGKPKMRKALALYCRLNW